MSSTLLPAPVPRPLVDAGSGIRTAPARWFTTMRRPDGYFHAPRSLDRHSYRDRRWESAQGWCGLTINDPEWHDTIPEGRQACGTCVGRLDGISHDALVFAPRDVRWLPKRWCPGPRRRLVVPYPGNWRLGVCQMCRAEVRSWADSWCRHEHDGHGLACSQHGWRWLILRGNEIACTFFRCTGTVRRFQIITSEADR